MTIYLLHTATSGDRPLEAWSLGELAELIECALAAGDSIDGLAANEPGRTRWRPLTPAELEHVLRLLTG